VEPPIALLHAKRAEKIGTAIRAALPGWHTWRKVGLHTSDGIKAPDLLVAGPSFAERVDHLGFLMAAPELCVEVMSPSNSWAEMPHKTLLYLAAGATEVWICDEAGELHFFDGAGQRAESALIAGMPTKID